jgi:hypothetical protein
MHQLPCPSRKCGRAQAESVGMLKQKVWVSSKPGNGKYHCTIDLLFDLFGMSCTITDSFSFYLQNRLIQTSQTGGQWYSDTAPFSIPCLSIPHSVSQLVSMHDY